MAVEVIKKGNRVMCLVRFDNKVYVGIGPNEYEARMNLALDLEDNKFARFDIDCPTSIHNSSVRTRV